MIGVINMMIAISFEICSFLFIFLASCFYFSKERIKTKENKIYTIIVFCTFFALIVEFLCVSSSFENFSQHSLYIYINVNFYLFMGSILPCLFL